MAAKKLRHEIIVWRDAWQGFNSTSTRAEVNADPGYYLVDSGWFIGEDRDEVRICMETNADPKDDRVRHVSGIPKRNIIWRKSSCVLIPDPRKAKHGR